MKRFVNRDLVFLAVVLLVSASLFLFNKDESSSKVTVSGRILELEDHTELKGGWLKVGGQKITARILAGPFQGRQITVRNNLIGELLVDRYVEVGDRAVFSLDLKKGEIGKAELVDYDRQSWHRLMFVAFAVLLVLFARFTGIKAFASFVFTVALIFKLLLPAILKGYDPLLLCLGLAMVVAAVTLLLVGGFTIRTLAAVTGVATGMVFTAILIVFSGSELKLDGMACEHSLALFFSGYSFLDLDRVFWGAVILGASGAMVDISIAVSTAVEQVVKANPALSAGKLIQAGFEVGRAALGTMVTTLLLAYAGCSIFLLLLFQSQNTHMERILNYNFVSAEIFRTLSGSIGMVLVAPLTAIIAGILYHRFYGTALDKEKTGNKG